MRRSKATSIILFIALIGLSIPITRADGYDNPPPVPGFTHTPFAGDDNGIGELLSGNSVVRSSPVIAEVDSNRANHLEVVVGSGDGTLYVYKSDGTLHWQTNVMPSACTPRAGDNRLNSSPAVGYLDGPQGDPFVVVGYGTIQESNCDGGIVAYNGRTGALRWRFSLHAWRASQGYPIEALYGVVSSPALADTDGDGKLEIGIGGLDRNVYLLNADGTPRWYYHAADTVWSSPAFANIDPDPALEMLIGTDISPDPAASFFLSGGYVYAFDTQPRTPLRIEYGHGFIWQKFYDQAFYSSPVIANVLPGNPGSELMIGASCSADGGGKWIKILRLSDGLELQTLNAPECIQSSVAVGDLDDDGQLEVVAISMGVDRAVDIPSRVMMWNPTNPDPAWTTIPRSHNGGNNDPYGSDLQSPVVAHLDGNGSLEVAVANFWSVVILNGKTGQQLTYPNNSRAETSLATGGTVKSTPAVGDINQDGQLDLFIGGEHVHAPGRGLLYGWTRFGGPSNPINSPAGSQEPGSAPWPMFRGNPEHTGVLFGREILATIQAISILSERGAPQTVEISFSFNNSSLITWSVSEADPQNILTLSPKTGTGSTPLQVMIDPPSTLGTYTASITVEAAGLSLEVPVSVTVVDDMHRVYLPLAIR